jgi:hypothetical protein
MLLRLSGWGQTSINFTWSIIQLPPANNPLWEFALRFFMVVNAQSVFIVNEKKGPLGKRIRALPIPPPGLNRLPFQPLRAEMHLPSVDISRKVLSKAYSMG